MHWRSLVAVGVLAGCGAPRGTTPPPALAVVIAVDQLRAELLDRYDTLFVGGFRRLRDEGFRFTSARVDHAITVSHPGHVSIASGDWPSHHGIVDAAWYRRSGDRWIFTDAVADSTERIPGSPTERGVSPRQILVSELPDWFVAADSEARVVAVGSGAYSSLLHGGKGHPDVYWYSATAGRYVTSTYYRPDVADWVASFNTDSLPRLREAATDWESTVPESARLLARPDSSSWEGAPGHSTFPHRLRDVAGPDRARDPRIQGLWLAGTPMLDAATLTLAATAVHARRLGQRGVTDYLAIVPSQVDDIGHYYGPRSQEQLDNLLRLDRELGDFFAMLDRDVGRGRWVVALTADHGIGDIPEYRHPPGHRLWQADVDALLGKVSQVLRHATGSREAIAQQVAALVEASPFVADAMTPAELLGDGPPADSFITLYRHSYRNDRVPRYPLFSFDTGTSSVAAVGVAVRLREGAMLDLDRDVHGSPYDDDRRVPIIFLGAGVPAGMSARPARTIDVAPTLAALAGVTTVPSVDGQLLPFDGLTGRR